MPIDLEAQRFGSANFANRAMRRKAGLHKRRGAYIGHDEAGRPHFDASQAAILLCGGARSLKGSTVIPWLVDGCLGDRNGSHHIIALDFKRQDTVVGSLQVRQGRRCYYFNPRGAAGMLSHRMNPCEHFVPSSPTLVADALLFAQNWIPNTDPRAACFEGMAQKLAAAAIVTEAREPITLTRACGLTAALIAIVAFALLAAAKG